MFPTASSSFGGGFGGVTRPGWQPPPTPPSFKQAYPAAVTQTGQDYSGIMEGYKKLFDSPDPTADIFAQYKAQNAQPYTPAQQTYTPNANVAAATANAQQTAQTGGFSAEDIANLRARGISPIRAVYANAQRQLESARARHGGYSPNQAAATAKMARDLSAQIGDTTTNINANLAQMIAQNKMAGNAQFLGAAQPEAAAERNIGAENVAAQNRASEFNRTQQRNILDAQLAAAQAEQAKKYQALAGQASLYGTTPALASTFGNQAMQAAQLQQGATQYGTSLGASMAAPMVRTLGR